MCLSPKVGTMSEPMAPKQPQEPPPAHIVSELDDEHWEKLAELELARVVGGEVAAAKSRPLPKKNLAKKAETKAPKTSAAVKKAPWRIRRELTRDEMIAAIKKVTRQLLEPSLGQLS